MTPARRHGVLLVQTGCLAAVYSTADPSSCTSRYVAPLPVVRVLHRAVPAGSYTARLPSACIFVYAPGCPHVPVLQMTWLSALTTARLPSGYCTRVNRPSPDRRCCRASRLCPGYSRMRSAWLDQTPV